VRILNKFKDINVIGHCANKDCSNELVREDEYLIDDRNLYCDSICYTSYMLEVGTVREIK